MDVRSYFAAANGYTGFRSYFNSVFNSREFDHVFILKGGPGTGKSTLMKKIAAYSENLCFDHDKILCSSDPASLDGVIVHSERGNFAILDGTSPHERDTVFPGAIDTLVDLGEGFNVRLLKECREEILRINELKKNAYSNAYNTLKAAGAIAKRINELIYAAFSWKKASIFADKYVKDVQQAVVQRTIMLQSAFCKHGIYNINEHGISKESIKVLQGHGEGAIFMNILEQKTRQNILSISYDPLEESTPDAISIPGCDFVLSSNPEHNTINTSEFLEKGHDSEELLLLETTKSALLKTAQKHFADAAEQHFKLEKIYSSAMDFEKNDNKFSKIINAIF